MEKLALLGGTPVIEKQPDESLFKWPIMTKEDEDAAMDVYTKRLGEFTNPNTGFIY